MKQKKIAILGGGFAGISAARTLKGCGDVTLVDQNNYFEWTPNIHELLSNVKTIDDLQLSYESLLSCSKQSFLHDQVLELDVKKKKVTYASGLKAKYDAIILALGHQTEHYDVSGATQHTFGFKSIGEVLQLKARIEQVLNKNQAPGQVTTISVVGGGFTGIEILGELYRAFADTQRLRLQLIEKQSSLLSGDYPSISHEIEDLCRENQVQLHLSTEIREITEGKIQLGDGSYLDSDITIWAAGTSRSDFKGLDLLAASHTGLYTNEHLQAFSIEGKPLDDIYIAGDLANIETIGKQAKQAYHALNMGIVAAENCLRFFSDTPLKRYQPQTEISLLSFGQLNTYALTPAGAAASPLLAAAKESVFQLQMANLSRGLPVNDQVGSIIQRNVGALARLAIPQLRSLTPLNLLKRSKLFAAVDV